MRMTRGKRIAITCFCIFLGFMAVCTVAAKGIYRAGLPQVFTQKPYSSSLTHVMEAKGIVKQRQEYGFFVEGGLYVVTIAVKTGEKFTQGQQLFQVDTRKLQAMIREKQLALDKLKSQQLNDLQNASYVLQEQQLLIARAKEDYEDILKEADILIAEKQQLLKAAQWELALYDQYASEISGAEASVSGGDAPAAAGGYNGQLQRHQLVQAAVEAANELERAKRQKEDSLQTAVRAIEDAEKGSAGNLTISVNKLDIAYQEELLADLEKLLEADGWITADADGQMLEIHMTVGEKTQEGAGFIYAKDDKKQVIEALFEVAESEYWSPAEYLEIGTELSMRATLSDGTRLSEEIPVAYREQSSDGILIRLDPDNQRLFTGQTVDLSYRAQTENYSLCIPASCIYKDSNGNPYVFAAEEREGILGSQWQVRRINVTVEDRTDAVAAVSSVEITEESRIVYYTSDALTDGKAVRLIK